MSESLLTMAGVRERVGLSPSMIYRLISQGEFPEPGKFGPRCAVGGDSVAGLGGQRSRRMPLLGVGVFRHQPQPQPREGVVRAFNRPTYAGDTVA